MPKSDTILKFAQAQKAAVVKQQDKTTIELIRNWKDIQHHLTAELNKVLKEIAAQTKNGENATPAQVYSSQRFKVLLQQVDERLAKYATETAGVIQDQQKVLIPRAVKDVNDLTGVIVKNGVKPVATADPSLIAIGWNYVNPEVVEKTVGLLKKGSVYYDGLEKIASDAVDKLRQSIITRVTTGEQPEQVAKAFQDELAGKLGRYITIARTATMEAYRDATTETQLQNSDIVTGWRWSCSLSFDTCAACLALNGQEFKIGEPMDTHWACNCSQVEIVKGFPRIKMQSGQAWLKSQPEDIQRRALGPSKYDAWSKGQITLSDLIAHREDGRDGKKYMEGSLESALANAKERKG